ncbi:MAG: type I-A CRISPR-associated protein Cas7/Csa2 [Thaumarchaeota archaeon]|jgi:CRISPR-associated protein Csa2|nr:type I-A CRISPR-associated protein Cas7/Csa2 [Candidatus Terraquivivens yellowstonensis]
MKDAFISIRGRVAINVEALNMTESVGNYVKHRRVPVMLKDADGSYSVYFMPAISGESIAHGLQTAIATLGKENGLKVCKLCEKGIFLKSTNKAVFKESFGEDADEKNIEKTVIENCVVEDLGGFLYAEEANVKRTSNFYVGYMIPVYEVAKNVVIEPQLHSRYALGTKFVKRGEQNEEQGQMLYYVELTSSVYTFSLDIDTQYIGRLTFDVNEAGKEVISNDERLKRAYVLLDAAKVLMVENSFGAKKTRFLPITGWESMVIAVSDKPWTVPSPFTQDYINNAKKKCEKINYNTKLYIHEGSGFESFLHDTIEEIKVRLKG